MRHVVLVLLAVSRVARADDDLPAFDHTLHWQAEPGLRVGGLRLDGQTVGSVGASLMFGARLGRVMLVADLSEMNASSSAGDSPSSALGASATQPGSGGTMDRVGGALRVYIAREVLASDMLIGDGWVTVGAGRETFTWDGGGVLSRGDAMVGLGGTFGLHGGTWHADERRWWGGMTCALYLVYAKRVDGIQPVACAGPCDMATRPSSYDRSIVFDTSIPFGK